MSDSRSLEHVLAQVKENEKKYNWRRAIESYNEAQIGALNQKDFLKAGQIQEKVGFCFHRAAFQAESQEEFKEQMRLAVEAYKKAHRFYEKLRDEQKAARMFRCKAVAKYLGYWLASDPDEKRKLLDDCLELEGKALTVFSESGEMLEYRRTYNELSLVFFCRAFLELNRQTLKIILEKGREWGEKAIAEISENDNLYKIAGTYLTLATCLSDAGFYLIAESEKIDTYRLKAVEYLNKTVELSEKADDAFLLGLAHLWLGINAGEEEAVRHHEKALEYGKRTKDHFIIANSLDYLAYDTYWKARARVIEDPEKRKELAEEAMQFYEKAQHHYRIISFMSPRGGLLGPPSGQAEHYYHLASWEPNPSRSLELLEKSEKVGMEALKAAQDSGMPMVIAQVLHVVSKTLQSLAQMEPNPLKKRDRLEKALKYRERTIEIQEQLSPFFYWNRGVMLNYLAGIKAEIADIEPDLERKIVLLREAVLSRKECLKLCNRVMPDFEKKGETTLFAALRDYQDNYAALLTRLYELTNRPEHLWEAIRASRDAIKSASKLDAVSLMAESYWKIAKAQDIVGEHMEAAKNFELASESYTKAAEKVPQLKDFYQDYASYMQAWSEIEKAKYHRAEKQHKQAKEHYEIAANLHKSTERWNYLSPNYFAWARLEEAEDLSSREQTKEAKDLFQEAGRLFAEAKKSIRTKVEEIEVRDEKEMAVDLIEASDMREEYCVGRIALEEAKILARQGDNTASSRKFSSATRKLERAIKAMERESDRQELMPIVTLSQAWQMMARAEAEGSPDLYLEASRLFDKVKELSISDSAKLLALGHSNFCKALEAGARFETTREKASYLAATQYLSTAGNHYAKAGFKAASEYAKATQRLFDAYIYIDNASDETDPAKKARFYIMAEKVLQASAGSYLKAKYPAKSEEVRRLLERIREERQLAVSLTKVLHAPTIASTATSFSTPAPTHERAVGLEIFEKASIQAKLILQAEDIRVGEDFSLKMEVANVGKGTVLLAEVEEILPPGFEIVDKPSYSYFEGANLNMRGRRLDPLKTEDVSLVLRSFAGGTFEIEPKITYVDETGHQMVSKLQPVAIDVSKVVLPSRVTTGHESLDNLLFGGIPENYAVILTSPSCDERDLLIKRFLEVGVEEGQITFYITTRTFGVKTLIEDFQSNFYLFLCNPQADETIKSLPNVFKLRGVENLTNISIALTSALRKLSSSSKAPRRCCIQVVSDVLLQHRALQTRRWLAELLPELKSKGFTVLAVMDPGMHSPQEANAVLDLFEGEISIYEKNNIGFLEIKRMAEQEYLKSDLPLRKR